MSWTLFDLNAMVDAKKALGTDPARIEKSDLVEILYAYQSGLTTGTGGGATTLDELTDVNVAGAVDGQVLKRIGGIWTLGNDETATPGSPGNLNAVLAAGNETTDKGFIFNKTLAAPPGEGQAVYNRWFRFDNLVKTTGETTFQRVPFNWWHTATQQYGKINEVMHFGWNMNQGGGREIDGLPGIGQSIESNYNEGERLVEMHDFYLPPSGLAQVRMSSYTVRTASQIIDHYFTVSRQYLKRPFDTDKVYWSVQSSASTGNIAFGWDINANKSIGFEVSDSSGLSIACGDITTKELVSLNFIRWTLPGIIVSGDADSSNIKIKGTADAVVDLETDNLCDLGVPTRRFRTLYAVQNGLRSKAGDLTTSDLPLSTWQVSKNTSTGAVKVYVNDGGTIKSVTLT